MSKKRPGVEEAVALIKIKDISRWEGVEEQHDSVIAAIDQMTKVQSRADELARELQSGERDSITKKELLNVVIPWKFSVGKKRNALLKLLQSNSEDAVMAATKEGIEFAKNISKEEITDEDVQTAIGTIKVLNGVGPATASVLLSWVRPDIFCYMYDEVIDCFLPKREYTLKVYVECRKQCVELSRELKWNPARVARAVWIAAKAKVLECSGTDPQKSADQGKPKRTRSKPEGKTRKRRKA